MGKKPISLKISNRIQELRAQEKISQEYLANEVGVTRATINSIEKGNYNPSLELAFKVAMYFEKDIKEIFTVEDK